MFSTSRISRLPTACDIYFLYLLLIRSLHDLATQTLMNIDRLLDIQCVIDVF